MKKNFLLLSHLKLFNLIVDVNPREYIIFFMIFYNLVWYRDIKAVIYKRFIYVWKLLLQYLVLHTHYIYALSDS